MKISEEEENQIRRWIIDGEVHAAALSNEWLKGLYAGEVIGYKVILRIAEMEKIQ